MEQSTWNVNASAPTDKTNVHGHIRHVYRMGATAPTPDREAPKGLSAFRPTGSMLGREGHPAVDCVSATGLPGFTAGFQF